MLTSLLVSFCSLLESCFPCFVLPLLLLVVVVLLLLLLVSVSSLSGCSPDISMMRASFIVLWWLFDYLLPFLPYFT